MTTPVREIRGVAVPFGYSGVDTDAIFPVSGEAAAAEFGFGAALFARWRTDPDFILNRPVYADAAILVAGPDFGIGSSRETAVWALRGAGFRAILAPSFGDIFRSNCVRNGVLTSVLSPPAHARLVERLRRSPGAELTIDLVAATVTSNNGSNERLAIDGFARHCLIEGIDEFDLLARLQPRIDEVLAAGSGMPDTRRVPDAGGDAT